MLPTTYQPPIFSPPFAPVSGAIVQPNQPTVRATVPRVPTSGIRDAGDVLQQSGMRPMDALDNNVPMQPAGREIIPTAETRDEAFYNRATNQQPRPRKTTASAVWDTVKSGFNIYNQVAPYLDKKAREATKPEAPAPAPAPVLTLGGTAPNNDELLDRMTDTLKNMRMLLDEPTSVGQVEQNKLEEIIPTDNGAQTLQSLMRGANTNVNSETTDAPIETLSASYMRTGKKKKKETPSYDVADEAFKPVKSNK